MIQKYTTPDVKITNQKFELYEEDGKYYLRVDFDYENEYGTYKGHVNKIKFDFLLKGIEYEHRGCSQSARAEFVVPSNDTCVNCLFDILMDSSNNLFTIESVKEKVHEMTVEQIEKKLGYKIKIVSKKKKV